MICIKKLTILGFGAISAPEHPFEFAHDRLNLVIGDNEAGKTTLAEAVYAALYGLNTHRGRKHTPLSHQAAWRPLGGGSEFGVIVEIADGDGDTLEARWNFEKGSLTVIDQTTGRDRTSEFKTSAKASGIGEALFDLSAEEFRKVCYIAQGDVSNENSVQGIQSLVQRFAASESGEKGTVGDAVKILNNAIQKYSGMMSDSGPIQIRTEIARTENAIAEAKEILAGLEENKSKARDAQNRLSQLKRQRKGLASDIDKTRHLSRKAELAELDKLIRNSESELQKYNKLKEERKTLEYLKDFPAEDAEQAGEIYGRLKVARDRESSVENELRAERENIKEAEKRLKTFGKRAEASSDDARKAENLRFKTKEVESNISKTEEAIAEEADVLSEKNILPDELDEIKTKMQYVEDSLIDKAADYRNDANQYQLELQKKDSEFKETGQKLKSIRRQRSLTSGGGAAFVGLGLVGILVVGVLAMTQDLPAITLQATGALGGLLVVGGVFLKIVSRILFAGELTKLREDVARLDEERTALNREHRRRKEQMTKQAESCGFKTAEEFAENAEKLRNMERTCRKYFALKERLAEYRQSLEEASNEIATLADNLELDYDRESPGESLDQIIEKLKEVAAQKAQIEKQKARAEELERELKGAEKYADQEEAGLMMIFQLADINTDDIEDGVKKLQEKLKSHRYYKQLLSKMAEMEENLPDGARVETSRRRIGELKQAIGNDEARGADFASLQPQDSSSAYNSKIEEISQKIGELDSDMRGLEKTVDSVLVDWEREGPQTEERLAKLEENLERVLRHSEALNMAVEELSAIQKDIHRLWADDLNKYADRILASLTPTIYNLRFEENLRFHVFRKSDGMEVTETSGDDPGPKLSRGQFDQVYFAVRLGIAEFLGGQGLNPPILLDDPFVNFDDSRFENAMRFLAEKIVGLHQAILFSCHKQRFDWLRRRNPELFDRHIKLIDIPEKQP